jgi:hypothetical protein
MAGRVFLATTTGGKYLTQAFGHSALVLDEGELVAYSYGGYVLPETHAPWALGWNGFGETIGDAVLEMLLPVVSGTVRARKVRQSLAALKASAGSQRMFLEELRLDEKQADRLHRNVAHDFATVELGEQSVGTYRYDHFANNCVTRLRDLVWGALDSPEAEGMMRCEVDESFEDVIEASLQETLACASNGIRLLPSELENIVQLPPGVPTTIQDAKGLVGWLRLLLLHMSKTYAFSSPEGQLVLAEAWSALCEQIPRKPRTFGETVFTPKRLREALATITNPASADVVLCPEVSGDDDRNELWARQ